MMAQDNIGQNGEASVEEILESIKKVIARDNRVGALEARRRRMVGPDEASDNANITPAPAARAHVVRDAPEPADEVLDLADMEFAADDRIEPSPHPSAIPLPGTQDTPLIADAVRDAMQENLAALAMLAEPPARPQIVRQGETSLEGLTRELLRPMLAEWLEANLPAMVEGLVQAEIARIVGKRR
jgi:cell pole-organizing protein PopZ